MGTGKINHDIVNINPNHKNLNYATYNCRVAMWRIPYDSRYIDYDTDNSRWLESINESYDNELEKVERELKINLDKYKVYTQTLEYDDNSVTEISKYANGNVVRVCKHNNYVITQINDRKGRTVAEKCYNFSSPDGRKTIYKHCTQGNNTFTIVRVFSYDTTKNKSSDVVNYGYSSNEYCLTANCILEKEYYLLNNKEVKAQITEDFKYSVTDEDGKTLIFEEK